MMEGNCGGGGGGRWCWYAMVVGVDGSVLTLSHLNNLIS